MCFLLFNSGLVVMLHIDTALISLLYFLNFFLLYLSIFVLIYNFQLGNVAEKVCCFFFVYVSVHWKKSLLWPSKNGCFVLFLYNSIYLLVLGFPGLECRPHSLVCFVHSKWRFFSVLRWSKRAEFENLQLKL